VTSVFHMTKPAGYWRIGGNFLVAAQTRPTRLHRWFTTGFLGWQWVDAA